MTNTQKPLQLFAAVIILLSVVLASLNFFFPFLEKYILLGAGLLCSVFVVAVPIALIYSVFFGDDHG